MRMSEVRAEALPDASHDIGASQSKRRGSATGISIIFSQILESGWLETQLWPEGMNVTFHARLRHQEESRRPFPISVHRTAGRDAKPTYTAWTPEESLDQYHTY